MHTAFKQWNSLPNNIVDIEDKEKFKDGLKYRLISLGEWYSYPNYSSFYIYFTFLYLS
jgi:hypothetical protein